MVVLEDAKKFYECDEIQPKVQQESLLGKYGIPIQHLDFDYVEKCRDGRELEKIVKILRSGEEGYFPDLTERAEERLRTIKPKSKLLTVVSPVLLKAELSKEERNVLNNDLKNWVSHVSRNDYNLEQFKRRNLARQLPEIREFSEKNVTNPDGSAKSSRRIAATDYSSWDKYDVDTEILKMDLEEEKLKKAFSEETKKKKPKKSVKFREFQSDVEAEHEAHFEREKGNEFFKVGDYDEALRHYTNSLNCAPNVASFTNRALVFLKLKRYKNACEDCNSALAIDTRNVKALVRKAQALSALKQHRIALESIERAIEIDPNNSLAQDLAEELRNHAGVILKNKRFSVQDVESKKTQKSKKNGGKVKIPMPGSSSMPPPYFVECFVNSERQMKMETIKASIPLQQIVHLVNVESWDEDDDDDCPINHLDHICTENYNKDHRQQIIKQGGSSEAENHHKQDKSSTLTRTQEEKTIINRNGKQLSPSLSQNKVIRDDKRAGGEPCSEESAFVDMPADIHSPFSFLKAWNSANCDTTLETHASILKSMDMNRIVHVIGCKLDNSMFSAMVKCLCFHFTVIGEVDRLYSILENVVNLPRFDIIALLMSQDDRNCIKILVEFLVQHDKPLSRETIKKLLN